jgi:hypothetical protein
MLVDFNSLVGSSKIWIYQSNREFSELEMEIINGKLSDFVSNWKRHGDELRASFDIRHNQFIILAVDEEYNNVSGCSIDASTHIFKQFESEFHIDLFNKLNTAFKDGEHINVVSIGDFQKFVNDQKIDSDTVVFNNAITTKKELDTSWEVSANESWHQRYF